MTKREMAIRASRGPTEATLSDLERRLDEAYQAVDWELQASKKAVSNIEKREVLYWCAFSEMETPFWDKSEVENTNQHLIVVDPKEDQNKSSEENALLPRELFPSKSATNNSLEEISSNNKPSKEAMRLNSNSHARKLREIMEELKSSMRRRSSL
jgi:hypothetical protein